jgi:hypothetical protein
MKNFLRIAPVAMLIGMTMLSTPAVFGQSKSASAPTQTAQPTKTEAKKTDTKKKVAKKKHDEEKTKAAKAQHTESTTSKGATTASKPAPAKK